MDRRNFDEMRGVELPNRVYWSIASIGLFPQLLTLRSASCWP